MAVSFSQSSSGKWVYARGTLRANFETAETGSGNMYVSDVAYSYANGFLYFLRFFASTAEHYADISTSASVAFSGDLQSTTSNGAVFATKPAVGQWLDADSALSSSATTLTTHVNEVPWFNYTNATLYERLKELYPGYKSFAFTANTGAIGTIPPNPYSAGLNSNYNYYSGESDKGLCDNAPGVSGTFATGYTATGSTYDGNPSDLEGQNWQDAYALGGYLLLTENPPEYKILLDMYIDGTSSPSIGVEWKLYKNNQPIQGDAFLDNAKIHINAYAPYLTNTIGEFTTIDSETGRRVLSAYAKYLAKGTSWDPDAGSYDFVDTMYNTIAANCMRGMSEALIIGNYGINKLPEKLFWFFQIESDDGENGPQFSEMWQLIEPREWETLYPDHQLSELPDAASSQNKIDLEVVLHSGKSNNMDGDDDNDGGGDDGDGNDGNHGDDWPDFDPYEPTGFNGDNVLTTLYAMPAGTLRNIGNKLWTQSYFDVLKVQSNPIENVVACKWFPFNPTGTLQNVVIGDVDFQIQAAKIGRMMEINIGSYKYTGRTGYHNFIDQTPFTAIKLHLPYIGVYQIDASVMFNNTLGVKYIVDLCTGECMAKVTIDGTPFINATGMIGVDIPITSSDRVQTELKTMSTTLKTGAGTAGEVLTGDILGAAAGAATGALAVCGADYTQQRSGNPSSACGSFQNHAIYLTFEYPDTFPQDGYGLNPSTGEPYERTGFGHTKGFPCHAWKQLYSFGDFARAAGGKQVYQGRSYFIQIDKRTEINIDMTSEESKELEALLTTGVYI